MHRVLAEIRRRKVHRTAALYLLGGYATVQAADLIAPLLELPDWSVKLVFGLVLAGLPLALVLSWSFQLTGAGLVRTRAAAPPPPQPVDTDAIAGVVRNRDGRLSILVAPFTDTSPGGDDEYIADGLTDEIIAELAKIESLRVIARSTTMRLKGLGEALVETARTLSVDYVLDGSVRKSGDDLRITVRLIHLETEESRWSERYAGTLNELFAIQESVARSVADALALRVGRNTLTGVGIEDPRAVECYLRARHATWHFSRTGLQQAERHLKNGLDIVGDNVLLLSSLGHVYAWHAQIGLDPDGINLGRAAECAKRVFVLEPDSARGHRLEGMVRFHAGDLRGARGPLERALSGRPGDPDTLLMLGYLSALSGQHDRARELFRKSLDVDPLTPLNHGVTGMVAILEGRPADALPHYRRYREMDPDSPFAIWCWIWALLMNGDTETAEPEVRLLLREQPDSIFTPLGAALLHGVRGDGEASLDALTDDVRKAATTSELFSRELTHCLSLAGRTDEALDWLENTIRIGNVNHPFWAQHDPHVRNIRAAPRFARLMEHVELEWRSLNPGLAN